jgi:hypothetical protein
MLPRLEFRDSPDYEIWPPSGWKLSIVELRRHPGSGSLKIGARDDRAVEDRLRNSFLDSGPAGGYN